MADAEIGGTLASAVEHLNDVVAIADADGRYEYINPFALRLLGYALEEVVGRSMFDLLHPDDLTTSTSGLALLQDPIEGLTVNPAYVRIRCADGTWLRIEINAGAAQGSDGRPRLAFVARPTSDADLYERLIGLLTSGATSREAFALVPEFGRWRQPALHYAVVHRDDDGAPAAVGSDRLTALADIDDPAAPWATEAEGLAAVTELDPVFRARAEAAGVTHLRWHRASDPLHGATAVVVLGQGADAHGGTDENVLVLMDYLFAKMATVLDLVLAWRHQVVVLRRSARTDPLTGVANRTGFWAGFADDAPAGHHDLGLLYVDLDRFKAVNDVHGHVVGDALLVAVAERLSAVVRPGDLIARMGGDEFTVVLNGGAEAAPAIAERIVATLAEPFVVDGRVLEVGASVGVAATPPSVVTPQDLLDAADRALYRAKDAGRGCWRVEPIG